MRLETPEGDSDLKQQINAALTRSRSLLSLPTDAHFEVTAIYHKLCRILFEAELRHSGSRRMLYGKIANDQTNAAQSQQLLWNIGFRPPALYTVPEPIVYSAEDQMFLQESAPGRRYREMIADNVSILGGAQAAAEWMACLHSNAIGATPAKDIAAKLSKQREELRAALPIGLRDQANTLCSNVVTRLDDRSAPDVAIHGDLHPKNILIDRERVTVIDLEAFGRGEAERDVGYFLAQTTISGFRSHGSLEWTRRARALAMSAYVAKRSGPTIRPERVSLYMATTFLQAIHHDVCHLKVFEERLCQAWLTAAATCVEAPERGVTL
jgi:hypothetical protein